MKRITKRGMTMHDCRVMNIPCFIILVFFAASCKENVLAPASEDNRTQLAAMQRISIELTDFNTVRVRHGDGEKFHSKTVMAISIGMKDTLGYHEQSLSRSTFDEGAQTYSTPFDFHISLDSTKIAAPFTIRYIFENQTFCDIDTTAPLYQYPYSSTQIICEKYIIFGRYSPHFQDVVRIGPTLYIHPMEAYGLYEYDFTSGNTKQLFYYSSGDHIAADTQYVYCDVGGTSVYRYNLHADSVDLRIQTSCAGWISGIDLYQNILYVALYLNNEQFLYRYTFDGMVLDSMKLNFESYYMAIHNGIMYSTMYAQHEMRLLRFDLQNNIRLTDVKAPSDSDGGMKFYHDQLYFCNFYKSFVGAVPIADLKEVPDSAKKPSHSSFRQTFFRASRELKIAPRMRGENKHERGK